MKTNPTMQAEAVLPTRPVSENGKINILTRLAYGGGDVACNVVYGMIATLLTLFYTDYAGVSVATVGLVMLISRFFDGGSDVVMGFIVDRTHSKWGQSRPWILWMSLPYALSAILLFSVPHTNATIQFLYIFVTYNLLHDRLLHGDQSAVRLAVCHDDPRLQGARSAVRIPHGPVPDGPYHCRHLHHAADQAVR